MTNSLFLTFTLLSNNAYQIDIQGMDSSLQYTMQSSSNMQDWNDIFTEQGNTFIHYFDFINTGNNYISCRYFRMKQL